LKEILFGEIAIDRAFAVTKGKKSFYVEVFFLGKRKEAAGQRKADTEKEDGNQGLRREPHLDVKPGEKAAKVVRGGSEESLRRSCLSVEKIPS